MGLKEILSEARSKIATEMNNAVATAKATIIATKVQPKNAELESAKQSAIKERTDAITAQISTLKASLNEEIAAITKQCEEAKTAYEAKVIDEELVAVKAKYELELSKLDTQIATCEF